MKLDLSLILTPNIREVSDIISKGFNYDTNQPYEVRVAGGAVRDILMGLTPSDIDLATDMPPEMMMELFGVINDYTTIDAGLKHGTVAVMVNGEKIEITTLRVDKTCDGRHAEVEFTHDWKIDALRRDFTINAMFIDMDGHLYDFFGGERDLKDKLVRFVGNPDARIQEDYLRILRFFRFNGKLEVGREQYDRPSLEAIARNVQGLHGISGERIWMEMQKIFLGPRAYSVLSAMNYVGASLVIGLPLEFDLEHVHTTRLYSASNAITVLTAGLAGDEAAAIRITDRWKLSGVETKLLSYLVTHDNEDIFFAVKHQGTYRKLVIDLCWERHAVDEAKYLVTQLGYMFSDNISVERELNDWEVPVFPVNGKDLQELGLTPGPSYGKILNALHGEWKRSDYQATTKDLVALVSNFL